MRVPGSEGNQGLWRVTGGKGKGLGTLAELRGPWAVRASVKAAEK